MNQEILLRGCDFFLFYWYWSSRAFPISVSFYFFSFLNPHKTTSSNPPTLVVFTLHLLPLHHSLVVNAVGQPESDRSRGPLSLCGWNSSIWLLWHYGARTFQPCYHGILPSPSFTTCQGATALKDNCPQAAGQAHLPDLVLKDPVVRASGNHTPEPRQPAEVFSNKPLKRLAT